MTPNPAEIEIPAAAVDHLRGSDPPMAALVGRVGTVRYTVDPDLWRALVGSIVGQQLSVAAARTIRRRVAALGGAGFPAPRMLLDLPEETLRGCGLSRAKVTYVRDLAERWDAGHFDTAGLGGLSDEEVIDALVCIRGVGRWTAEMALIFSLGRPDVLAVDDLGLRVGVQRVYELEERPGREAFLRLGEPWRPYRSYASLFLWHAHDE